MLSILRSTRVRWLGSVLSSSWSVVFPPVELWHVENRASDTQLDGPMGTNETVSFYMSFMSFKVIQFYQSFAGVLKIPLSILFAKKK